MKYSNLSAKLGLRINSEELFDTAFVHRSFLNENAEREIESNERLEFLGDAVLELAVTDHLFKQFPEREEGELTNIRSALVRGEALAEIARELELGKYLTLSKGEEKSGGREKGYILANTVESLIGAVYLDEGLQKAFEMIEATILKRLDKVIEEKLYIDAKSYFQEQAQAHRQETPTYELVEETGPDHKKLFTMSVNLADEMVATGQGNSKQVAEQDAAKNAINKLDW